MIYDLLTTLRGARMQGMKKCVREAEVKGPRRSV
jgi:hypothetical protein